MKRRRLVLCLVLMALAACGFWYFTSRGETVVLADGTKLTLRAVVVGTNTIFRSGGPVRRLATWIPFNKVRRWGAQGHRTVTMGNQTNLALWFTSDRLAGVSGQYGFRIADDFGTNVARFWSSSPMRVTDRNEEIVTCYFTPFWPRRCRSFVLQAFAEGHATAAPPDWTFRITNPLYANYPQWPAEQFPATRTVDGTRFTLQELVPARTPAFTIDARLRVTGVDGQPQEDWAVCGVQFRDATGNRTQNTPSDATRTGPGRWWVRIPNPLFAGEEAAKVGVGFVQVRGIPTNDVTVLRGVPVLPPPDPRPGFSRSTKLQEFTIPRIGAVRVLANSVLNGQQEEVAVFVARTEPMASDISLPDTRWFLVLGATDDRGRSVTESNRELDASMSRLLRLPEGVRTVDIVIAAPRVVFVEWTAGRAQFGTARRQEPP